MPADVLALFDLDHTLVPHDSDEQWVAFLIDEGVLDREHYDATNRELIARFNRGEASAVEFTEFYLSTLTRLDDADLEHRRERFIASRIRPRISASVRELVERHRAAGDLVVLTTAVMRFLAQPIAAEFGIVDVIATDTSGISRHFKHQEGTMKIEVEGKLLKFVPENDREKKS